jgi:hypothetical protein
MLYTNAEVEASTSKFESVAGRPRKKLLYYENSNPVPILK